MNDEPDFGDDRERTWPITRDLTCDELAAKVAEYAQELSRRPLAERAHQLENARRLWPNPS